MFHRKERSKVDAKGGGRFHWVGECLHHRPHTRSHLMISKMIHVQYHLLGHGQRGGEGGVETVRVKSAEVLHLSVVKIRIQVIHRHLLDQISQIWLLFGGFSNHMTTCFDSEAGRRGRKRESQQRILMKLKSRRQSSSV